MSIETIHYKTQNYVAVIQLDADNDQAMSKGNGA